MTKAMPSRTLADTGLIGAFHTASSASAPWWGFGGPDVGPSKEDLDHRPDRRPRWSTFATQATDHLSGPLHDRASAESRATEPSIHPARRGASATEEVLGSRSAHDSLGQAHGTPNVDSPFLPVFSTGVEGPVGSLIQER